jgi:hypothetical protein
MSRDDGFAVADVSVNLYDDDKVKRLYRELGGDLGRMGHAMMLAEATLLASWRDGRRRTVHEAAPLWLTVDDDLVAALVKVGLLDRSLRRPARAWAAWFGPAYERREKRRKAGALGGRPRRSGTGEAAKPSRNHPVINRKPRPADRPVRTVEGSTNLPSRAGARDDAPSNGAERGGGVERVGSSLASLVDPVALAAIGKVSA